VSLFVAIPARDSVVIGVTIGFGFSFLVALVFAFALCLPLFEFWLL
jgi:hypothetical protein